MFNKRHYNLIAQGIKAQREFERQNQDDDRQEQKVLDRLASNFAARFEQDNPKFDYDRFINATYEGVKRHANKQ